MYSSSKDIVILWTLVDNFFYNFGVTFITNLKRVINLLPLQTENGPENGLLETR
jgi:hypothetical protein